MGSGYPAVDLDGFFLVELVLAVFSIINLIPLSYGRSAPIDNSLLLQVEIRRLVCRSEVLNVKLEAAELDCVTSCKAMVMKVAIFLALVGVILICLLRL